MSRLRALWQASISAIKRALTWNIEDLMPPSERFVFNFNSKEELKRWHLYSDSEYGDMCLSSASLKVQEAGSGLNGIFSGSLSPDVIEGSRWRMNRSGFCGMHSKKLILFDGFIDLDAYDTMAMKLKGYGRCYISTEWVNILLKLGSDLLQN
ncbi:probable complex I intermediate-associated protein 30 [Aristolochia californica]|uniref:probable complex I intermediate-associated protein 30 n=1 Tax=Aristolochia californica TaxID=171875 RepID=UPI0035DDD5F8